MPRITELCGALAAFPPLPICSTMKKITIILKKTAWHLHDYLGLLILWNLLWWVAFLLIIPLPPATAAVFHVARKITDYEKVTWGDFFAGFSQFFWRGWGLFGWTLLVYFVLAVNVLFYWQITGSLSGFGRFWAGICLWLGIGFTGIHLYAFPILVRDDATVWQCVKKSFWLFLDNIHLNLLIILFILPIQFLLAVFGITLVLIFTTATALVISVLTREVLRQYRPERYPLSSEEEEQRSWRHVFQPWT